MENKKTNHNKMYDYLKWRGDIPFSKASPFNEVDGMIFARIAYLPLEKFTKKINFLGMTIGQACEKMSKYKPSEFKLQEDLLLVANLISGKRFSGLVITDYHKITSVEEEMQFAAVTIKLPGNKMVLCFSGTDSTLVGWKEDLNMSFMKNVPSHAEGHKYATRVFANHPTRKAYFVGHSKGGNVSIYSAITTSILGHSRILGVYNYDGPGFVKEVLQSYKYKLLKNKIHTYVPQDSFFGRMLEHNESIDIVYSSNEALYQHDTYSWDILGTKLVRADKEKDTSKINYVALRRVIESTSTEERKIFVDFIYELFNENVTPTLTVEEIGSKMVLRLPEYMKKYNSRTPEQRKTIEDMLNTFIWAYTSAVVKTAVNKIL